MIKKIIQNFYHLIIFLYDVSFFKIRKKNHPSSYQMMIKLYSLTGGLSNDLVSFFVKKKKQNKNIENQYILDEKKIICS